MNFLNWAKRWVATIFVFLAPFELTGCSPINAASTHESPVQITATIIPGIVSTPSPTTIIMPTHVATSTASIPTPLTQSSCSKESISGYVLSGGDTTPGGLKGGPRLFLFRVESESGDVVKLAYTSYPPSPNIETIKRPKLNFHAGEIKTGDYIESYGCFDVETNTLFVEEEGAYIETFPAKP